MRAKVLNLNELNINKHKAKPKVKYFYSRTTLILDRCSLALGFPARIIDSQNVFFLIPSRKDFARQKI